MGIFEAIGKGFSQAGKLVGVIVVFFIINLIYGLVVLPFSAPTATQEVVTTIILFVIGIIYSLIYIFPQAGALGNIKDVMKTGSASMDKFVEYGKTYYLRILGLVLIYLVISLAVVLVLALLTTGIFLVGYNVATVIVVSLIITVVALAVITLLLFPIYSIVADDVGPVEALKNGISIAMANFWKSLGLIVTVALLSFLIALPVFFVIGALGIVIPPMVSQILMILVNSVLQSYLGVVIMIAFMAFYMSLKADETAPTDTTEA